MRLTPCPTNGEACRKSGAGFRRSLACKRRTFGSGVQARRFHAEFLPADQRRFADRPVVGRVVRRGAGSHGGFAPGGPLPDPPGSIYSNDSSHFVSELSGLGIDIILAGGSPKCGEKPAICRYFGDDRHIAWVIVDYKTDRSAASQISSNEPQFAVDSAKWGSDALECVRQPEQVAVMRRRMGR